MMMTIAEQVYNYAKNEAFPSVYVDTFFLDSEIEQDYERETTIYTYEDGSKLEVCGGDLILI